MVFRSKFKDATLLYRTFGVIHDLISECPMTLSKAGISIMALDATHVSILSVTWPRDAFEEYVYDQEDPCIIGLHIGHFMKMLKCAGKNDTLSLSMDSLTADTLSIHFENSLRTASFEMKLLNIDEESMMIPEMQYDAHITMDALEFQTVCKDLSTLADTVTMRVHPEGLTLASTGDIGKAMISYRNAHITSESIIEMSFALRYLNSFAKASSISQKVSLEMCDSMPLRVQYSNPVSCITFYVAPKLDDIEEHDEEDDSM